MAGPGAAAAARRGRQRARWAAAAPRRGLSRREFPAAGAARAHTASAGNSARAAWAWSASPSHPHSPVCMFVTSCRGKEKPITFWDGEGGWFSTPIRFVRKHIRTLTVLSPELGVSCAYVCHTSVPWSVMHLCVSHFHSTLEQNGVSHCEPKSGGGDARDVKFLSLLGFLYKYKH